MADKARAIALKALNDLDTKGSYINLLLKETLRDQRLSALDKAFITELIYGVVRYRLTLDWLIEHYSNNGKPSGWLKHILRLGIYQILYMDKVPDFAACDSSVELAKRYGGKKAAGFVNAVLRRLLRERDDISSLFPQDAVSRISLKYSYPRWMVELWLQSMDEDFVEALCAAQNQKAPLTIRVNALKLSVADLKRFLDSHNVKWEQGIYLPEALIVEDRADIEGLPGYSDGLFAIQDEASMMVAHAVEPKPHQLVIDACSAPGGKSAHMAALMGDQGRILAMDIHPHRVELIKAQCRRLHINSVEAVQHDSLIYDQEWDSRADAVLIDAPCSGLGIIRRKPDIKWSRTMEDIEELLNVQVRLLDTCSRYVKPGGAMVYSTCTINPRENQDMIANFLRTHDNFILDDVYSKLPLGADTHVSGTRGDKWIQFYPNQDKLDGFFIARMIRTR